MAYPVPEDWTISGILNKNGVPFSEGKVYADNLKNGLFQQIAESGISADGSFELGYSNWNFQEGDSSIEFPTIRIRVEDYQGNNLWTSNIYKEPSSSLNIGSIDILKHPDENGDCRFFGTVQNEQGNILENIKIVAYCLHFVDTSAVNEEPSGYFERIILGETVSNADGKYERRYSSSLLPAGLLLDSKEDYGKDKASLYAEAYEEKEGIFYRKAIEHLIFNGKSNQEINFILKTKQESFKCEYEKLDDVLKVYRNAIISRNGDLASLPEKNRAIGLFLNSNTEFPLVAGRERIIESKVQAYFSAHGLLLQLQHHIPADYSQLSDENDLYWHEVFFVLALKESVTTLHKFAETKPTIIQKILFGAVSDGLICTIDTTPVLNLWKQLINNGTQQCDEDHEKDDALTISQLLCLFIKGDLSIEYPPEGSNNEETSELLPHYYAVEPFENDPETTAENQERFSALLDSYYSVGADINAFIKLLQENVLNEGNETTNGNESSVSLLEPQEIESLHLSQNEVSRLKALFDLNDFFGKFSPGVVCAYRYITHKQDFVFNKLSDLLLLDNEDWKEIVDKTAEDYFTLYHYGEDFVTTQEELPGVGDQSNEPESIASAYALPAEFPGNNRRLKKIIYTRKLAERIIDWFPQQALLLDLKNHFEDTNWSKVCEELTTSKWENFSLSNTDLDEFTGKNEAFFDISGITVEIDESAENQEPSLPTPEDENSKKRIQTKEKILQLQRLFHLTENAEAIAYLIDNDFKSAYQISTISEKEFIAQHGNGFGKVEEARRIHRLAQNYMAEASLNIQAYATSSIEEPLDESEEDQSQQSPQNEQLETLQAIPRALPKTRLLKAEGSIPNTNTARIREATRDAINWAGLFGNINFTKATQGQSILSATAYYVDLLKFLKKSSAYSIFIGRRPDFLDLHLTKANAEIPVPTIDLGIELLESLVAGPENSSGKVEFVANNNPDNVNATALRAEPIEFRTSQNVSIDNAASSFLATKIYPFHLPANFSRDKAKKILSNLSLHFYDIAELFEPNGEDHFERRELRLDNPQRSLADLVYAALNNENNPEPSIQFNTWDLWGLKEYGNEVLLLDKNSYATGNYIGVLRRVAVTLQRTGFTIQDIKEVLNNKYFNDVCCRPKDTVFYQLSNINGYEFAPKKVIVNNVETEISVDWDFFFKKMAVLVHRKNILNWSLSDVLITFDLPLEDLDIISELICRYGITVQDTLVLGGAQAPTEDFLSAIYQLPQLISNAGNSASTRHRNVLKLLGQGLNLSDEDSSLLCRMVNEAQTDSFLEILFECYRYNLISKTLGIPLSSLSKLLEYHVWDDSHNFASIRSLSDKWGLLSGTSIDVDFYLNLLSPVSEEEQSAAANFASNLTENDLAEASSNDNLKLLVCAEFGIAEDDFELLTNISTWQSFYQNHSVNDYADLSRRVALFNYIQTISQGIDISQIQFVQEGFSGLTLENLWKLVEANYTTDRLLSGDFNLDYLIELMTNEHEGDEQKLEDILALDIDTINRLSDATFGESAPNYSNTHGWMKFTKAYELYSKTHYTLSDLEELLSEDSIGFDECVRMFESTVKGNTKESDWIKFAQEMNDDLRKKKRDALAAYVCWESCSDTGRANRYPRQFIDENDIYAYYLMDIKMEPDMTISRIVQASASIQLFVQRAELGLEGEGVLNDEQRYEWKWMKNYRVWEAARKVFLYPENWIASDLRDDKTPFFEELEERIQEFSDDHTSLENALYEYLEKVREVSSIEIVGATKEDGGDEDGILYTLHIVGRTQGEPHTYYYRKYKAKAILSGEWTPWLRLDVDIPSEIVVPAVVKQRLYLLWPQITLGQRNIEATSNGSLGTIEYYAKIQICWTSYTGTKWTGTRMTENAFIDASTNQLDFTLGDNERIEDRYHLKTESSQGSVAISIIKTAYRYQEYEEIVGSTEVMEGSTRTNKITKRVYDKSRQYFKRIAIITINTDGSDTLEVFTADYQPIDDFAPERTKLVHGVFTEVDEFTCGNKGLNYPEDNAILNYTPGLFRIIATNLSMLKLDEDDETENLPFFYMDGRRTFFVQSVPKDGNANSTQKNYKFELLSHTLVDDFYKRYRDGGTKWLYTRETQALPVSDSYYYSYSYYNYYFSVYLGYYMAGDWQAWDLGQTIFRYNYWPNKANVDGPYPAPMVDFVWGGANAIYNWELFFYVPMLIAEKMIAEQSYEEALLWLQLVFDPRENYTTYEKTKQFIHDLPKGARYWKFLPFFANKDADKSILQMLGLPTTQDKLPDRSALSSLVDKWKNDPFNPHLIARYRNVAYQKYVVMKYLDALIGWGDQEFSKDTTESVNLAIQFYLLAAELLGPKNHEAPEPEPATPLKTRDLFSKTDDLSNAFIKYENSALIGKRSMKSLDIRAMDERTKRTGNIVESMFYFSIPRNDNLFSYWDTIADRLYKIRNSLNIQGVKRTLALFAPPIDPGMLVKARAMGISIDSILNSANEQHSIYRFRVIVKLAIDMAKEASQMGRDFLAILEKKDAEQLQVFKAKCNKAIIAESKAIQEMEIKSLETEKARLEEKKIAKQSVSKKKKILHTVSATEKKYQKLMEKVAKIQETVEKVRNIASATYKIPDFKFGAVTNVYGGPRFDMESIGGTKLAENLVSAAEAYAARFAQKQLDAAKTKLQAEFDRRKQEWTLEDDIDDAEIVEIEKQSVINDIKTQQLEKRYQNLEKEILRSEEAYDLLCNKFTNQQLYIHLEKDLGKTFKRYVNLLLEVARMAEWAYHFEIPNDSSQTYIQSNYWESLYKGLLAPEKILLDLRALEKAYLENDKHKMEIIRPILLFENLTNPIYNPPQGDSIYNQADFPDGQYITITKIPNVFEYVISIEKNLFDNDFPNHTNRFIKDIRVQIITDSIIKSYTCLNAELSITSSTTFNSIYATSMALQDAGKFDFKFVCETFSLFDGTPINDELNLTLKLSGLNSLNSLATAKVIIYISYTAIRSNNVQNN